MAKSLHGLTVRQVETNKTPGRLADGGGLYLRTTASGARSWIFRTVDEGKQVEVGLGSAVKVSLALARQRAAEIREAMTAGQSLKEAAGRGEAIPAAVIPTFGAFAEEYITSVEAGWRNPVHRQQWRQSLRDHAAGLTDILITEIGTDDVLAALQPICLTKAETAKRVRGRIEKILDAAKARGIRARQHQPGRMAQPSGLTVADTIQAATRPPRRLAVEGSAGLHGRTESP